MSFLLINPPVTKPGEPPAGIAKLSAALAQHGTACRLLDANLEGLLHLMGQPGTAADTWSRRASKNLHSSLAALRSIKTFESMGRYTRAVMDSNRVLEMNSKGSGAHAGFADYHDARLSPVRSRDLLHAAEHPEQNAFYAYFRACLPGLLDEEPFSVIGFSLNFLSQALTACAMAGFLRKQGYAKKIIFGGGLITSWMRRPGFKNPFAGLVDLLIDGPGERSLLSLAGIASPDTAGPLPDYSLLPLESYLSPGAVIPYSASSGCYWNKCAFCPEKAEGNPYLPVSADRAAQDLKALAGRYRPTLIHLLDNALSPAHMMALIENPPGAPWYGFARVTPHLADHDFCGALRRSGCVMLQLGLESGDDDVLARMNKGMHAADAAKALLALKQASIATYVYLLFGTPHESPESARRTLGFTVQHHEQIGFLNLAIFNMTAYEGSGELFETRSFNDADLSLYTDFVHPLGWDRKKVRRFLDREFKRHPAIAGIVKRDPPVFTSSHAAFFVMKQRI